MTSPEERPTEKFMSPQNEAYLQAMGITVWHQRGISASEQSSQTEEAHKPGHLAAQLRRELAHGGSTQLKQNNAEEKNTQRGNSNHTQEAGSEPLEQLEHITPISFAWMQLGAVMVLCDDRYDKLLQRFGQDVLVTLAWLHRDKNAAASAQTRSQRGGFQWPQLENASGTPARSLKVWFDKYAASGVQYWYAENSVVKQCQAYTPQPLITVPNFSEALNSPRLKKSLWFEINRTPSGR